MPEEHSEEKSFLMMALIAGCIVAAIGLLWWAYVSRSQEKGMTAFGYIVRPADEDGFIETDGTIIGKETRIFTKDTAEYLVEFTTAPRAEERLRSGVIFAAGVGLVLTSITMAISLVHSKSSKKR
jgi:hypothetical protein